MNWGFNEGAGIQTPKGAENLMSLSELRQYPIHDRLRERAPGLTIEQVDSMLKDAWTAGFSAGCADMQPAVDAAERRGMEIQATVERVVGGRLIHVAASLRRERPKSTIVAEREWMERQAAELDRAIGDLRGIPNG